MPKPLPLALEPALGRIDTILLQQAAQLASPDTKVTVADLCRLFQLRLDLADRFETVQRGPYFVGWVDPDWMNPNLPDDDDDLDGPNDRNDGHQPGVPAGLIALDRASHEPDPPRRR